MSTDLKGEMNIVSEPMGEYQQGNGSNKKEQINVLEIKNNIWNLKISLNWMTAD